MCHPPYYSRASLAVVSKREKNNEKNVCIVVVVVVVVFVLFCLHPCLFACCFRSFILFRFVLFWFGLVSVALRCVVLFYLKCFFCV